MFVGFVGLTAMSTSLSPLLTGPSFDMFVTVSTRGTAWAADTPTPSATAASTATRILNFTCPSPRSLCPERRSLAPSCMDD